MNYLNFSKFYSLFLFFYSTINTLLFRKMNLRYLKEIIIQQIKQKQNLILALLLIISIHYIITTEINPIIHFKLRINLTQYFQKIKMLKILIQILIKILMQAKLLIMKKKKAY